MDPMRLTLMVLLLTTSGCAWRISGHATIALDASFTADERVEAMKGVEAWEAASPDIEFNVVDVQHDLILAGQSAYDTFRVVRLETKDDPRCPVAAVAAATTHQRDGETCVFMPWSAPELSMVVSHEIGHQFGLGHVYDSEIPSIMHPSTTEDTPVPTCFDVMEAGFTCMAK